MTEPVAGSVSALAWAAWQAIKDGGEWSCPDVRDRIIRRRTRYPTYRAVGDALDELVDAGWAVEGERFATWRAA